MLESRIIRERGCSRCRRGIAHRRGLGLAFLRRFTRYGGFGNLTQKFKRFCCFPLESQGLRRIRARCEGFQVFQVKTDNRRHHTIVHAKSEILKIHFCPYAVAEANPYLFPTSSLNPLVTFSKEGFKCDQDHFLRFLRDSRRDSMRALLSSEPM